MASLFGELYRRNVFRVALVYAVVSWLIVQIADVVLPTFNTPAWVNQTLILLLVLGFPLASALAWAFELTPEGIKPDQGAPAKAPAADHIFIYATFSLVLVVAIIQVLTLYRSDSDVEPQNPVAIDNTRAGSGVFRSSLILKEKLVPDPEGFVRSSLVITADGTRLYYTDRGTNNEKLYTRLLSEADSELVNGEEYSLVSLSLSPDSQNLLVRNGSSIASILPVSGLARRELGTPVLRRGVDWMDNNTVIYPGDSGAIYSYAIETGENKAISQEALAENQYHINPHMLPGKNALLFAAKPAWDSSRVTGDVMVMDLDTKEYRTVIRNAYDARYAVSGHIVFIRQGDLWAVPFDKESLRVTGIEKKVIEGIASTPYSLSASYTFSATGRLVYLPGKEMLGNRVNLVWMNKAGEELGLFELPAVDVVDPQISPDNRFLSVTVNGSEGQSDIWVYDMSNETFTRRTYDGNARNAIWTSNSRSLIYALKGDSSIWRTHAVGLSQPEMLYKNEAVAGLSQAPESYNLTKDEISFTQGRLGAGDIYSLTYNGSVWESKALLVHPNNLWGTDISRDGKWIAYSDSAEGDVFVSPFPNMTDGKLQISFDGGREPYWSPTEMKLYYLRFTDQSLMSVDIDTSSGIYASAPVKLFSGVYVSSFDPPSYELSPDGERFLIMRSVNTDDASEPEGPVALSVVDNWFEELNRLAPPAQ
jgi:hypothetical protein